MRGPFRVAAGIAGALACGAAGATWCALTPPAFEAAATASVETGTGATVSFDLSAIRSLVGADSVLRRAALRPEAAAAIQRESRPGGLDRFVTLLGLETGSEDTLARAAEMLAPRVDARPGPVPGAVSVAVRMSSADDAAQVATAVAEALVAEINEIAAHAERRTAPDARANLARAGRRRAAARDRLETASRIDFAPTASMRLPMPPKTPEPAASDLAPLARAAAQAETRRLEAARTLGPKHPQLIQIETEARRAAAALAAARARSAATARRPAPAVVEAEGGPDPRAAELAEAARDAANAEADYEFEAARSRSRQTTAQLVRAAPIPAAPQRRPSAAIVAASALLGFLFAGAAPALSSRANSIRPNPGPARPVAALRSGALDPAGARCATELLRIAETHGARRVLVLGEDRTMVGLAARAIAQATLEAGWRPLLIASGAARKTDGARQTIALDGEVFRMETTDTRCGPLKTARRCHGGRLQPIEADLAFDLVIFEEGSCAASPHAVLWIGAEGEESAVLEQCRRRGVDPRRLVGRIASVRSA